MYHSKNMPLGLVSELYDQCQGTLVLLSDFIARYLDRKYSVDIMPAIDVGACTFVDKAHCLGRF